MNRELTNKLAAALRDLLPLVPFDDNHADELAKGRPLKNAREALREFDAKPFAGRVLSLSGRRWFGGGNTYFSALAYLDGEEVARIAYEYGYGDHWRDRIFDDAMKTGALPARKMHANGYAAELIREWAERHGIELHENVRDVKRKKDL